MCCFDEQWIDKCVPVQIWTDPASSLSLPLWCFIDCWQSLCTVCLSFSLTFPSSLFLFLAFLVISLTLLPLCVIVLASSLLPGGLPQFPPFHPNASPFGPASGTASSVLSQTHLQSEWLRRHFWFAQLAEGHQGDLRLARLCGQSGRSECRRNSSS